MIRRKIKNQNLRIRPLVIGKRTHTQINMMYLEGIVEPQLVSEVERRLKNIDTDAILAAGYVEQYIDDAPYSAFPTIWSSEKPDAVAGKLLEGRVAVVVDGAPFVLTMLMLFVENFQSAEDYITRTPYATMLRILRILAFFLSMFAPGIFIALSSFHQELIPTTLLFTMVAASEGTPFPSAVEMAMMVLTFEILREAGVRIIEVYEDQGKKKARLEGTAVFKDGKIIGELGKTQTQGLLYVMDKAGSGSLPVTTQYGLVILELRESKCKLKPVKDKDGKFHMELTIVQDVTIQSNETTMDTTRPENSNMIKQLAEEAILMKVEDALGQARALSADVFAFGEAIRRDYPDEWEAMKEDWDMLFPQIELKTKVDVKLRSTGGLIQSVYPGGAQ